MEISGRKIFKLDDFIDQIDITLELRFIIIRKMNIVIHLVT